MGLLGAAWAKNTCDFILALMLYLFITFKSPTPKTWIEWDRRAFDNFIKNLKSAIKNGLGCYIEEAAFLLLTLMSTYFDDKNLTVTHIALNNSGLGHISFFLGF